MSDTSNYEVKRPLPIGKSKKVIVLMKDELDGKIVKDFVKIYSYLIDDGLLDKRAKGTKKCVMKQTIVTDWKIIRQYYNYNAGAETDGVTAYSLVYTLKKRIFIHTGYY